MSNQGEEVSGEIMQLHENESEHVVSEDPVAISSLSMCLKENYIIGMFIRRSAITDAT